MDRILVSMTSIPTRIVSDYMQQVIDSILRNDASPRITVNIIIHLPRHYQRLGDLPSVLPSWMTSHPNIHIHHPPEDYGPGTKWLGLASVPSSVLEQYDWIVIMDDDILYRSFLLEWMMDRIHSSMSSSRTVWGNYLHHDYELTGFSGFAIQVQDISPNLLQQSIAWFHEIQPCCRNVDDTFLTFLFRSFGFRIACTTIPMEYVLDFDKSETSHPHWFELKHTHREIDTFECKSCLTPLKK